LSNEKNKELDEIFVDFDGVDPEVKAYYEDMGVKIVEPTPEETEVEREKRAVIDLAAYCKKDITTILVPIRKEGEPTTFIARNIIDATSDEVLAWAKYAIPSLVLAGVVINTKEEKMTLFETVVTYLVSMRSSWKNTGAKAIK
jgi:hypothetical protein